jgi:3-oxoacyl-(acyl-carrier-protein) synthase
MKNYRITSSVILRNGVAICNGKIFLERPGADIASFCKELYRTLNTDYSKFFKMDNLCKLAFISAELLVKDRSISSYQPGEVALVFSNASASLDTDKAYFESVEDKKNYFPSPAVFVYTLPNIMMGEICIRHKLTGENTFFVSERFDAKLISTYAENLLTSGKAKSVIAGWVEINDRNWDAALFLIEHIESESKYPELNDTNMISIFYTVARF